MRSPAHHPDGLASVGRIRPQICATFHPSDLEKPAGSHLRQVFEGGFRPQPAWAVSPPLAPAFRRRPSLALPLRPRNPRATSLYPLLETHFETLKRLWEERFERRYGFWQAYWAYPEPKMGRAHLPGLMERRAEEPEGELSGRGGRESVG
jgi:hypothetical protein